MGFYDYFSAYCAVCDEDVAMYNKWTMTFEVVSTDCGLVAICSNCSVQEAIEKHKRVPCTAINKNGLPCKHEARNEAPFKCRQHGGKSIRVDD